MATQAIKALGEASKAMTKEELISAGAGIMGKDLPAGLVALVTHTHARAHTHKHTNTHT
jgi:hypothetical protein